MVKNMKKSTQGFSLLELMIAMVIISAISMGLMATHFYAKKQQILVKDRLVIMAVLEKEMNGSRIIGARNLVVGTTSRTTTLDQDGVDGTVTTEIMAGRTPKDRYVRIRLDWGDMVNGQVDKHESLAGFIFSE